VVVSKIIVFVLDIDARRMPNIDAVKNVLPHE